MHGNLGHEIELGLGHNSHVGLDQVPDGLHLPLKDGVIALVEVVVLCDKKEKKDELVSQLWPN